jgi:hypothetical protein
MAFGERGPYKKGGYCICCWVFLCKILLIILLFQVYFSDFQQSEIFNKFLHELVGTLHSIRELPRQRKRNGKFVSKPFIWTEPWTWIPVLMLRYLKSTVKSLVLSADIYP